MAFNVSRRQVFFVKGKKNKPRSNWMKQAQQQKAEQQGVKDNSLAVFGSGIYARPAKKPRPLALRILGWTLSLAALGVMAWGTVLIARAVMSKLEEQPTIAESIAKSRTWRGQAAGVVTAPPPIVGERGHAPSNEESFIATSAYHGKGAAEASPAPQVEASSSAATSAPRAGAHKLDDCGVASHGAGASGAEIGDCLKKLDPYTSKK